MLAALLSRETSRVQVAPEFAKAPAAGETSTPNEPVGFSTMTCTVLGPGLTTWGTMRRQG